MGDFNGEGSEEGFAFSLLGGAFWLIIGLVFFGWITYDLFQVDFVYGNIEDREWFLWRIVSGFLLSFFGIWIIYVSSLMRRIDSLKKGVISSLILGILSLNIFAIVGGILGLARWRRGLNS